MKTTTTTYTIAQRICDHCGKPSQFSQLFCIVCGKAACGECRPEHLVILELDTFPKFWPPSAGLPRFHAYACPTCRNKLTRRFAAVKSRTAARNDQCERWHEWYLEQIRILNDWKDKAEKQFELPDEN